jgi:hypothetical protein
MLARLVMLLISSCRNDELERRTVCGTLRSRSLAATTADTDTVDDVSLLGLVTKTASLVGARRARGTVDDVQLTELY